MVVTTPAPASSEAASSEAASSCEFEEHDGEFEEHDMSIMEGATPPPSNVEDSGGGGEGEEEEEGNDDDDDDDDDDFLLFLSATLCVLREEMSDNGPAGQLLKALEESMKRQH